MLSKRSPDDQSFHYEGFASPNGTFVPDDLFDLLAPRLSEAELRVLLYIIRRTFGFGKHTDAISLKQLTAGIIARDGRILDYGTGMSRKGVIAGIKGLLDKGIINVHKNLDDRGENQVNIYTLHFRDGVVTQGNYRSYQSTLPVVTSGNPQESVSQESARQQLHAPREQVSQADPVVVDHENDLSSGRPDLYEALRDLGVHHHTASRLLREYDQDHIELMTQFVTQRLQQGWTPQESVAAWLVAAIRKRYEPPATFRSREQRLEEAARMEERRAQEVAADRAETQRVEDELQRQRAARLVSLGIEQSVDEMWQKTQDLLRQRGLWSVAMSMCFLSALGTGLAVVLVPSTVKTRIAPHKDNIVKALQDLSGQTTRMVLHEI